MDRIKKLNRLAELHTSDIDLAGMICGVLADELASGVILADDEGLVLCHCKSALNESTVELIYEGEGDVLPARFNDRLLHILSTQEIVSFDMLGIDAVLPYMGVLIPVVASGERLASILVYRLNEKYTIDDIIFVEHVKSLMTIIFGNTRAASLAEANRKKQMLQKGLCSLSRSELVATSCVLKNLLGDEGVVIAKVISENTGVSRSVIVAALKKLDGAGVIECRSSGSHGTYVKILDEYLRDAIDTVVQEK